MWDKVNTLKLNDEDFPEALRHIDRPPQQLYYRGAAPSEWLNRPRVAIVGSRKVTAYGRRVTERLAGELARQGVVIISGLAYGVDGIAHQAAVDAGGLTVAVLGSSLERIYPVAHQGLAQQMIKGGGTLISEFAVGQPTRVYSFIARNRLISGLAEAVLVTEAARGSGSLHTAQFGLDQGRMVMAVPGNIDSYTSEGSNNLIKSGALTVTSADDVLLALGIMPIAGGTVSRRRRAAEEELVYRLIKDHSASQEELAQAARLDGAGLNRVLTALEISGDIRPAGGGYWTAV